MSRKQGEWPDPEELHLGRIDLDSTEESAYRKELDSEEKKFGSPFFKNGKRLIAHLDWELAHCHSGANAAQLRHQYQMAEVARTVKLLENVVLKNALTTTPVSLTNEEQQMVHDLIQRRMAL